MARVMTFSKQNGQVQIMDGMMEAKSIMAGLTTTITEIIMARKGLSVLILLNKFLLLMVIM